MTYRQYIRYDMDLEERIQLDILVIDDVIETSLGAVAPERADAETFDAGANEYIEIAMRYLLDLEIH